MSEHEFYNDFKELHKAAGSYAGGACLQGHVGYYEQRNSCSYRWQGLKKANQSPGKEIYNSHPKPDCHLDGSGHGWAAVNAIAGGRAGVIQAQGETKTYKTKKGKSIDKQKVVAKNFTNGFAPYANQVHHVLPTAVLRESVMDVATPAPTLKDLICKGLLQEKYNINFMDNMIILPVRVRDARRIGLPTHCGSHPGYSAEIKDRVKNAMRPYQRIAEQIARGVKHDESKPEKLKSGLEVISDTMYAAIVGYAQGMKMSGGDPASVNDLPSSVFDKLDL